MTSGPIGLDLAEVSKAHAPQLTDVPAAPGLINEKNEKSLAIAGDDSSQSPSGRKESVDFDDKEYPTPEEVETLRRVAGAVPWASYTIAFIELCERFSYYGTTVVCKLQFIPVAQPQKTDMERQSSTSSSIHYPKGPPLAHQAPMDSPAHWISASEPRPA